MNEQKLTRRYFVAGRVQGVGYRMFVQREAQKLGAAGFTRNLHDGRVEVLANGTSVQLAALKAALLQGPRFSSVKEVREEPANPEPRYGSGFVIEQDE